MSKTAETFCILIVVSLFLVIYMFIPNYDNDIKFLDNQNSIKQYNRDYNIGLNVEELNHNRIKRQSGLGEFLVDSYEQRRRINFPDYYQPRVESQNKRQEFDDKTDYETEIDTSESSNERDSDQEQNNDYTELENQEKSPIFARTRTGSQSKVPISPGTRGLFNPKKKGNIFARTPNSSPESNSQFGKRTQKPDETQKPTETVPRKNQKQIEYAKKMREIENKVKLLEQQNAEKAKLAESNAKAVTEGDLEKYANSIRRTTDSSKVTTGRTPGNSGKLKFPKKGGNSDNTEDESKPFVYKEDIFKDLCQNPVITAADSSLNGSEILLFKDDMYYVLKELRYGTGKLKSYGQTKNLLQKFDTTGFTSFITIKEGYTRGHPFAYYEKGIHMGWSPAPSHKIITQKARWSQMPFQGFDATLHNRQTAEPIMVGLKNDRVYYYKTDGKVFSKLNETTVYKSVEKFPPNITAAFSMPNGFIFLFRDKQFCTREWVYEGSDPSYCDNWQPIRKLLGCYGQSHPPYSIQNYVKEPLSEAHEELCTDLSIADADFMLENDTTLYLFRDDKYWIVEDFPVKPVVTGMGVSGQKWNHFMSSPDAVVTIKEGAYLRGSLFAFYNGDSIRWRPDIRLKAKGRHWGEPYPSRKFGAVMHNSNFDNPMVVGFDGNWVHYYNTGQTTDLYFYKKYETKNSPEKWPSDVTAAFLINDQMVYLFRGDRYCLRQWECDDSVYNCCKVWKDAKALFLCDVYMK